MRRIYDDQSSRAVLRTARDPGEERLLSTRSRLIDVLRLDLRPKERLDFRRSRRCERPSKSAKRPKAWSVQPAASSIMAG